MPQSTDAREMEKSLKPLLIQLWTLKVIEEVNFEARYIKKIHFKFSQQR